VQLAARLGLAPAQLRIKRDLQGRPYLADGNAEFSISRSGNMVALALAPAGCRVGIDIEVRRRIPAAAAVAREFLPPCLCVLVSLPREDAFLTAWTVLEASLKAGGERLDGKTCEHQPRPHRTLRLSNSVCTVALSRPGRDASELLEALRLRLVAVAPGRVDMLESLSTALR
jgi:phosphopantetheinyl transferase